MCCVFWWIFNQSDNIFRCSTTTFCSADPMRQLFLRREIKFAAKQRPFFSRNHFENFFLGIFWFGSHFYVAAPYLFCYKYYFGSTKSMVFKQVCFAYYKLIWLILVDWLWNDFLKNLSVEKLANTTHILIHKHSRGQTFWFTNLFLFWLSNDLGNFYFYLLLFWFSN